VLTVLSILGVLAVLFVAAAVATREGPILLDAPADIADVVLPPGPLQPEDLNSVRFGLAIRGYRMDEVDRVLERAASEIGERDARIAELLRSGAGHRIEPAQAVTSTEAPAQARARASVSPVAIKPVGTISEPLVPAMPVDSAEALDSFEDVPADSPKDDSVDSPKDDSADSVDSLKAESTAPVGSEASAEADEPVASLLADSDEPGPVVPIEPPLDSPPPPPAEPSEPEDADDQRLEPPPAPPEEVAVVPVELAPLPPSVADDAPPGGDDDGSTSDPGRGSPA
jgi:DivIVA domain-containing protein